MKASINIENNLEMRLHERNEGPTMVDVDKTSTHPHICYHIICWKSTWTNRRDLYKKGMNNLYANSIKLCITNGIVSLY